MKKFVIITVAVVAALALALTGCSKKPADTLGSSDGSQLLGGWQLTASPVVTDDVQALLDKALEGYTGAGFKPVAYVATQIVNGTNHLLVCRTAPVIPDATSTWALVTVYEDLDGNVTIGNVQNSGVETYVNGLMGGWQIPDSPVISTDLANSFEHAMEGFTGSKIEPVALLSTQLVSGTNYKLLALVSPVSSEPKPAWALVTVYVDLQGNAQITDITKFEE